MTPAPAPQGSSASRSGTTRARNERLAGSARRHHFAHDAPVPFLCECSDPTCVELVRVTLQQYSDARGHADFVTAPGHQVDGAKVVRVRDSYWLYRAE